MQGNAMKLLFAVILALQLLTACKCGEPSCGDNVTITPASKTVQPGENVTIECHQKPGLPPSAFLWHIIPTNLSSARVIFGTEQYNRARIQDNILMILNVTAKYAGKYFCESITQTGSCITNKSVITIFEKASITVTPEWNRRHAGETLNLSAVVTGNPLPTIITVERLDQLTGLYVDYPITKYSVMGLSTISFTALSLEDNGQYRACVENSHDSIECSPFTIMMTGPPMIESIPPITVKEGGSLSVVCRVLHAFGDAYEMTWQMANGSEIINNSFSQVIELSTTELQLFVTEVTKANIVDYICVIRNNSRILTTEHVHVSLTSVPSPPKNLKIQSTNFDGRVTITWTGPETDNGSPLTSYYVTISVEGGNTTVTRVIPDQTSLYYFAGCNTINVTVTSENDCGNSSSISSSIDVKGQCVEPTPAETSVSDDNNALPIISAGIVVVVVFIGLTLVAIIIFVVWWKRQKKEIKQVPSAFNVEALSNNNIKINSLKMTVTTTPPPLIKRNTSIRRYRNMLEVPRDSVILRDLLHDGNYFELRKGLINIPENENRTHEVMVKKAKQSAPFEEEHSIQEEIKMMSTVGVHENVVGLLRTCLSESPAYLITEYFSHGDLLGFLRASRGHYGMYTVSPGTGCKTHHCAVQGQDLLKMVKQVAAGMSYLAEKKVTHRSLCARNVLVGTGLQVKVYNYGPKADSEAVPQKYAKWMAPETLFDGTANTMSDVWSFGITLWEIITIGGAPYPHTHPEQMRELLRTGHRLHKPDHCDESLYIIMDQCWNMDPNSRPTFVEVHRHFDEMCKSKLSYLNLGLYNDEEYSQFEETQQLMTAL